MECPSYPTVVSLSRYFFSDPILCSLLKYISENRSALEFPKHSEETYFLNWTVDAYITPDLGGFINQPISAIDFTRSI